MDKQFGQLAYLRFIPAGETNDNRPRLYSDVFKAIKNSSLGELFKKQAPRWPMGYKGDSREHIAKYIIDPEIVPNFYAGFKQDLIETPISDSDSLEHMLLVQKVGQILLAEIDEQNPTNNLYFNLEDLKNGFELNEYLMVLNLTHLTHDLQEAFVGDSTSKSPEFKIREHLLYNIEVRKVLKEVLPLKSFDKVFDEMFKILFAEEKLKEKYKVEDWGLIKISCC